MMNGTRFALRATGIGCLALLLGGCLTPLDPAPTDILDERTGNTYTTVAQPLVFARRRMDLAANAREYATVVAARLNHAGRYATYLLVYRWATPEVRPADLPLASQGRVRFVTDGGEIAFTPLDATLAAEVLRAEPAAPRTPVKQAWAYAADAATLRRLAAAHALQLQFPDETAGDIFELWADGRAALAAFAAGDGG